MAAARLDRPVGHAPAANAEGKQGIVNNVLIAASAMMPMLPGDIARG